MSDRWQIVVGPNPRTVWQSYVHGNRVVVNMLANGLRRVPFTTVYVFILMVSLVLLVAELVYRYR